MKGSTLGEEQARHRNKEFNFGHGKFEQFIKLPSGDTEWTVGYTSLEYRGEFRTRVHTLLLLF